MVLREAVAPQNYVALGRTLRAYPHPVEGARRYFLGSGDYPRDFPLRTPLGAVAPRLFSHNDMWTVNEIFCRQDYPAGPQTRVVVDIGSNIGISALWFLTRNSTARAYLYEPVPNNTARLRANLAAFDGRWHLQEVAVADRSGEVVFGVEPSGRYGGIGVDTGSTITVPCRDINDVVAEVLEHERQIDVLKLDTEGIEMQTVAALRPELLPRITSIFLETEHPQPFHPERYDASYANQTLRLTTR